MLRVEVDRTDSNRLHDQVAAEIRRGPRVVSLSRHNGFRPDDVIQMIESVSAGGRI